MCGIVAYFGQKAAQPIMIEGLKRLEYRGYDSAGVAFLKDHEFSLYKTSGRIANLEEILPGVNQQTHVGIGHTRWATHGEPNTINAHPHVDYTGKIALVHNGIIENYSTLKKWLIKEGCAFKSDTDTEVVANLIGYFYDHFHDRNGEAAPEECNRVRVGRTTDAERGIRHVRTCDPV